MIDSLIKENNNRKSGQGHVLYFLGNQRKCADLLLIISKPSTDSSTLTYSITRHTMGGGGGDFATQGNKPYLYCVSLERCSPYMKRSNCTVDWATKTLWDTWALPARTASSRSSWNRCLEVRWNSWINGRLWWLIVAWMPYYVRWLIGNLWQCACM